MKNETWFFEICFADQYHSTIKLMPIFEGNEENGKIEVCIWLIPSKIDLFKFVQMAPADKDFVH